MEGENGRGWVRRAGGPAGGEGLWQKESIDLCPAISYVSLCTFVTSISRSC